MPNYNIVATGAYNLKTFKLIANQKKILNALEVDIKCI